MHGPLLVFLFLPGGGVFGLREGRVVGPLVDLAAADSSFYMEPFTQRQVTVQIDSRREGRKEDTVIVYSKIERADFYADNVNLTNFGHVSFRAYYLGFSNDWEVEVTAGTFQGVEVNHTLCFESQPVQSSENDKVLLSLVSYSNISLVITLDLFPNENINLDPGALQTVNMDGRTPKVYRVPPVANYSGEEYFLSIESRNSSGQCLHVAINRPKCPWIDKEILVRQAELEYRMLEKGFLSLKGPLLRSGFILSIIPLADSRGCYSHPEQMKDILPGQISVFDVSLTREDQDFAAPIVLPVLVILFLIILPTSLCVYFILRQILDARSDTMETNKERERRLKLYEARCWKERQRSKAFMLIVPLIGAFYGILAVQYVLEVDTSVEKCYKNYGCARNGFNTDLNHLVSNIGFLLYGAFFVLITAYKYKKVGNQFVFKPPPPPPPPPVEENGGQQLSAGSGDASEEPLNGDVSSRRRAEGSLTQLPHAETTYGILQQYSIFHALGLCLFLQGVYSIIFHTCPSDKSLQIDTSMMAFMMMLGFVKVHQLRHHEYSFNAYFIMWYLLVPMLLVSIYVNVSYNGRIVVYSVFVMFHLATLASFYADMYLGQGQIQSWSFFKALCLKDYNTAEDERSSGPRRTKVFSIIGGLVLVGNVVVMCLFFPQESSTGSKLTELLLCLYAFNLSAAMALFFFAKFKTTDFDFSRDKKGEFLVILMSILFFLLSFAFMVIGGIFYYFKLQKRGLSPPESRNLNARCGVGDFYDRHDIWHFCSSTSLYLAFITILIIDDNLMLKPSHQITPHKNWFP